MLEESKLVEIYKTLIGVLDISFGVTGYTVYNVWKLIYYKLFVCEI